LIGEDKDSTIITGDRFESLIQIRRDWVNVSGFTFINGQNAISLFEVQNCRINSNLLFNTKVGISLHYSKYNNITGNSVINSSKAGIWLTDFGENNVIDNNISTCETGIWITTDSTDNLITENNISNNRWGIKVRDAHLNRIMNNNISFSEEIGIWIEGSVLITLEGNAMIDNGIYFGQHPGNLNNHYIDSTNTVNGKPLQYWKNQTGGKVPQGAGQVILANCTNVSVEGQELTNATCGIILSFSSNNTIKGNNVSSNSYWGIQIIESHGNDITDNVASLNDGGMFIGGSDENSFIGNTVYDNEWGIGLLDAVDNVFNDDLIFNNNNTNVFVGYKSWNNRFINCTLSNPGIYDFKLIDESYAFLLNTTFNKTSVFYADNSSGLTVAWYMHLNVIYSDGSHVNNAQIWVNDTFGFNHINRLVDSEGWIKWIVTLEYDELDINVDGVNDRFYYTPYNITVTDSNLWGYTETNMEFSKVIRIILGESPPIIPPKKRNKKFVNSSNNVELEVVPPISSELDHDLIQEADTVNEPEYTLPDNNSPTNPIPENFMNIQKVGFKEETFSSNLLISASTSSFGLLLIILYIGLTEKSRYRFFKIFIVPLLVKFKKRHPLENQMRELIYRYIEHNPGENYTTIKKTLGLANGTLIYHLKILKRENMIKDISEGRYKRFYPMEIDELDENLIYEYNGPQMLTELQWEILKKVRDEPQISKAEMARSLGVSRQLVNYHLNKLVKVGLLKTKRKIKQESSA
jgi:parallel beta-helix repeat protein